MKLGNYAKVWFQLNYAGTIDHLFQARKNKEEKRKRNPSSFYSLSVLDRSKNHTHSKKAIQPSVTPQSIITKFYQHLCSIQINMSHYDIFKYIYRYLLFYTEPPLFSIVRPLFPLGGGTSQLVDLRFHNARIYNYLCIHILAFHVLGFF